MEERAFAKINISLDVLSKMSDGYHAVRLVMQSVSLHDTLKIDFNSSGEIKIKTGLPYIPEDDTNIAVKAAKAFYAETGISGGCSMELVKRTPTCAGLGGGSSDAAAVLRAMDRYYETHLGREKLCEIGARVGSDVPFCIAGGTALAEGRGEKLTMLSPLPECYIVICKPAFSISTPKLFASIKCDRIRLRPDTAGIISGLEAGDISGIARRMYNVFEDVLGSRRERIGAIKSTLIDNGALGACMSGTGSAVFGIYTDASTAEKACRELENPTQECFVCTPVRELTL